ncbi:adenylosuccinate lyase [Candidatus Micrarchaeota archaeon]|nr:adenylosuccinate lyase [Candidatus Micrarchaeota archaeon]
MASYGFDDYLSPFTWRYASQPMRSIFSEHHRRLTWRRVWAALAFAQHKAGKINKAELDDIEKHVADVDVEKSLEIEKEIRHDLVAELRVFSSQCKVGGGKLHWGATSMDIEDNADVLHQMDALKLLTQRTASLLFALERLVAKYKDTPCMAYTHLQSAEPSTLGYRFAVYAQDVLEDLETLEWIQGDLWAKGLKGATGTAASYLAIMDGDGAAVEKLESDFLKKLGLTAFDVATQTYSRKQDYELASVLAGVAESLHKMALDIRLLQMQHEVSEPFKTKQVGSSAMPFKRNPISCERICSLARLVAAGPQIAWENAANNGLERTLDDSANRRVWMAQSFLALDEMLLLAYKVADGLVVNEAVVQKHLEQHGPFALTEVLLMALVQKGHSRQDAHEKLREKSMAAWNDVLQGKPNPLLKEVKGHDVSAHTGLAGRKAAAFSKKLKTKLKAYKETQGASAF